MRAPTEVPLPQPNAVSEPFWAGCADRRLLVQQCRACGSFQSPPRLLCRACRGGEFDWRESAGRGAVFTFTVAHHPASPALRDAIPYAVVVVKLDDCGGVLVTSNLLGAEPAAVRVGLPVRLIWDQDVGVWLPRFEPDPEDPGGSAT